MGESETWFGRRPSRASPARTPRSKRAGRSDVAAVVVAIERAARVPGVRVVVRVGAVLRGERAHPRGELRTHPWPGLVGGPEARARRAVEGRGERLRRRGQGGR